MIKDYFAVSFKNLRRRKVRSWLTMLGIIISVATIFMLVSISVGLQGAVQEEFRLLGTDKFFIMPKGTSGAPGTTTPVLITQNDLDVIKRVSGVKEVTGFLISNAEIKFNNQIRYEMVAGMDLKTAGLFFESSSISVKDGRALKAGDVQDVGLGYSYKYGNIFDKPIDVGDTIYINSVPFKVRGIMSKIGSSQDDKNIYIPEDEERTLFNITNNRVDEIIVQILPGENVTQVAANVEKKLRSYRGVTEKTQDFIVLTPNELLNTFGTILTVITAFLSGIAAISLVVGGIGIANTMYTSVLERTQEIGTMKAVGAKNKDILFFFLIESGLLGLTGGIIGVLLGIIVSKAIQYIAVYKLDTTLLKAAIPPYLVIGCLVFAFGIGALFGVWPAYNASKVRPVEALRYE
jgi:putative ABC transport system permease protein